MLPNIALKPSNDGLLEDSVLLLLSTLSLFDETSSESGLPYSMVSTRMSGLEVERCKLLKRSGKETLLGDEL